MGGFLAPLFFAALAALAIPVLVHLTHRERREPVVFPSLMFLQKIPFRTQRRQRLRHLLLFALRALAIILLVAAFARPFVARRAGPGGDGRDLVILLDRSASMGARGVWQRARAAASAAIAGADVARIALVAFDDEAEALTALSADRADIGTALGRVTPGSRAGRLGPGLLAAAALAERDGRPADVVLISDFQRGAFDAAAATRLLPGSRLRTVDVGDSGLVNNAVTAVTLERGEGRFSVTARLAASGGEPRTIPVVLELDGRAIETVPVALSPGGTAVARFASLRDPESARRARVLLPDDDLAADNAWHVAIGAPPRIPVVVATRSDAAARDALYLREALAVAAEPAMPMVARGAAAVRAGDLAGAGVLALHDVPFPGGDAGRRIMDWVRAGGGLLIALGARGTLPAELADSVGSAGAVADRGESGGAITGLEATHPIFEGWARAGIASVRGFRYRRLEGGVHAPARWDDGAPALAEIRVGMGRVLVWTADFGNRWSDLPLQPAFVPMIHAAVKYLAGFTPPPAMRLAGDLVELPSDEGTTIVESPSGARQALRDGPLRFRLVERGFYQVRPSGQAEGGVLLAANVPPSESDPARVNPAQMAAAVAPDSAAAPVVAGPAGDERDRGRQLWWYALAAVLLLFAAESAVAHAMRGQR